MGVVTLGSWCLPVDTNNEYYLRKIEPQVLVSRALPVRSESNRVCILGILLCLKLSEKEFRVPSLL